MKYSNTNNFLIETQKSIYRRFQKNYGRLVAFAVLFIFFAFVTPSFFKLANISNIFRTMSTNMLLTLGMTLCLLIGGIDLSIGQSVALCNIVMAILMIAGVPWYIASLIGILIGSIIGMINGIIIAYTKIPPFIQTLSMQVIVQGVAYIVGSTSTIMISDTSFNKIGNGDVFGLIPIPTVIIFTIAFIFWILLKRTKFGAEVYAIGGNINAAYYSGISNKKVQIICYSLSGMTAGIAGMILLARLMGGQPNIGSGKELNAIAAAVIGGVSFSGGKGSIGGAVVGAIFIECLNNGMNVWGLNTYWQYVVTGGVVLGSVLLNYFISSRRIDNKKKVTSRT